MWRVLYVNAFWNQPGNEVEHHIITPDADTPSSITIWVCPPRLHEVHTHLEVNDALQQPVNYPTKKTKTSMWLYRKNKKNSTELKKKHTQRHATYTTPIHATHHQYLEVPWPSAEHTLTELHLVHWLLCVCPFRLCHT